MTLLNRPPILKIILLIKTVEITGMNHIKEIKRKKNLLTKCIFKK